jgi:predicted nucleotidyltransferase
MVATTLPRGVIERIVEVLDPEEVWLFGSRARETHGPDSDWDLMAVLPNTAADHQLDIAAVWADLRELRRMRIESSQSGAVTSRSVDAHHDPRISGPAGVRVGRSRRTEKSEGPSHQLGPSVVDPERGLRTR